jgi:type VI secretion system secreted protein VgrG
MSSDAWGSAAAFTSSALGSDGVQVLEVDGVERIGHLYELRVRFSHRKGPLTAAELDALCLQPCSLTIGDGQAINGIARSVETLSATGAKAIYDVFLVPTLWLLSVSKLSRLYQKMDVKGMAADVLGRYGLMAFADLRLDGAVPRDFAVQYQESDWDYLQRWFEHEGYFYWFEHSSSGEKLVVADDNSKTTPISGNSTMPYRDLAGLRRDEESVFDWRCTTCRIPANVVLKDYNELKPLLPMVGHSVVDAKRGFGVVFEYGDNFDTPTAGNALAKKRAERIQTERFTVRATTDSPRFHVGHSFELDEHFDDAQNGKYLVTAIRHRVGLFADGDDEKDGRKTMGYRAEFEAIPLSQQFRTERKTPWPSIHGLMHGHIDSGSEGKFSTLDDKARYRVRFPFDTTGQTGETCSTWVRMAQHYAGSSYGSHFPLHKGTEVLLAFYDGDPDRPVIMGSVSNALTPAPSAGANATQSRMKTASGIHITMDDQV